MDEQKTDCSFVVKGETINDVYPGVKKLNSSLNCSKDATAMNKCGAQVVQNKENSDDCSAVEAKGNETEHISNDDGRNESGTVSQNTYENGISTNVSEDFKVDSLNEKIHSNNDNIGDDNSSSSAEKKDDDISNLLQSLSIRDNDSEKKVDFVPYKSEEQLPDLVALITKDLSEPYSVYTYRYFLHNWPHLSHLAYCGSECVGAIVCKLDVHRKSVLRGYIAMLVVHKSYRRFKIGSSLVRKAIMKMIDHGCEEVVLETEVTNKAALQLYENLGFVRDKRLLRYYLNGVDAWRLKLWLK